MPMAIVMGNVSGWLEDVGFERYGREVGEDLLNGWGLVFDELVNDTCCVLLFGLK